MTTFKKLDRAACKTLRKDLESILEVLEDQHNIKIDIGEMPKELELKYVATQNPYPKRRETLEFFEESYE